MAIAGGLALAGAGLYASSKGAKDAARTQADAARQASEAEIKAYKEAGEHRIQGITEARQIGQGTLEAVRNINSSTIANSSNSQLAGINSIAETAAREAKVAQQQYEAAVASGSQSQITAAREALNAKMQSAENAANAANSARAAATGQFQQGVTDANKLISDQLQKSESQYQPYMQTGLEANDQLRAGIANGGEFTKKFSDTEFKGDPGYQFRLQQGQTGVENSAAARGGLLSGNALKAISDYNQNFASNEYGNAYDRFNTDMNNRFTRLSSLADRGMSATNSVSALGAAAAGRMSDNTMAGARYGADNTTASGLTTADMYRNIGDAQANASTTLGNIAANRDMLTGLSRAGLTTQLSNLETDRIKDVTNTDISRLNAEGKNMTDYATNWGNLTANGTLAIGNARADALVGAYGAEANGIREAGNATAAGQAKTGEIWGSTLTNLGKSAMTYGMS